MQGVVVAVVGDNDGYVNELLLVPLGVPDNKNKKKQKRLSWSIARWLEHNFIATAYRFKKTTNAYYLKNYDFNTKSPDT